MSFTLIDGNWGKVFDDAVSLRTSELLVVCPFLKQKTVQRLLRLKSANSIRVVTRFNLADFACGVSDTTALQDLLDHGASIRGIRGLHAKVYVFGQRRVIVTSANLTGAALSRNEEFGFVADDDDISKRCRTYFDQLWARAGEDLTESQLARWQKTLNEFRQTGGRPSEQDRLPDEGVEVKTNQIPVVEPPLDENPQAFVKFFGEGSSRQERTKPVFTEVDECGCHWACTYPEGKRPRSVDDGAIMFMGRLVKDPDDVLIFGHAIAMAHVEGRDDATPADIKRRDWKRRWPHYIRVHHAEFMAGRLQDGVSLNALMSELGSSAFASTQRNALIGEGNTDPRMALRQQPAVELSAEGLRRMREEFAKVVATNGKIPDVELETLDWPPKQISKQGNPAIATLTPVGLRLLRTLVAYLENGHVDVTRPETFPSYKDTIEAMGVKAWPEGRLGPQFSREGGHDLCEWLKGEKLPAFTGLIVNRGSHVPGGDFFKTHGKAETDFAWWLDELRRAKSIKWGDYCG
jgi:hypothetical protein